MLLRPTRIREKFGRFHISPHIPAKNAPDFTLSNKDTPKSYPILGANPCRRIFRGVCNTPLHGYVQNPPGFIFPQTDAPKTRSILDPNPWRRTFRGVCNTPLHGYMKNLTGFIFPQTTWRETRRVLDFATRHSAKPGGFWTLPLDMARNPAGFGLCHTT